MSRGFVKGVVVGSIVAVGVASAAIAVAGTGVGGVFNLGQTNSVGATSTLTGSTGGRMLVVTNTRTGSGKASAILGNAAGTSNPAVEGANSSSGPGVEATSVSGTGVVAQSQSNIGTDSTGGSIGVLGTSNARGIVGRLGVISCPGTYAVGGCGAAAGIGVLGDSTSRGVVGTLNNGSCPGTYAVGGCAGAGSTGVFGTSPTKGVFGTSSGGIGVHGDSTARGVVGTLNGGSCSDPFGSGTYGTGGCGGSAGDGLFGLSDVGANSFDAAAIRGLNTTGGDIFIGDIGNPGDLTRVVRIDGSGKGFFDGGTQSGGADYADSMPASGTLRPGDVLAIDPRHPGRVARSTGPSSTLVAGVYSTKPAVLGVGAHHLGQSLAGEAPVALVGIVPTRVSAENGAVRTGDLLVTARTPGYAMKAPARPATGTVLGKALQPLKRGRALVLVLVTLR